MIIIIAQNSYIFSQKKNYIWPKNRYVFGEKVIVLVKKRFFWLKNVYIFGQNRFNFWLFIFLVCYIFGLLYFCQLYF